MKILVTGGTGFLGYYLVQDFIRKNFDVTCLVRKLTVERKQNLCSFYKKNGMKIVVGDITDLQSLKNVFSRRKYDLIFHLAGVYKENGHITEVNVEGTRNILRTLSESKSSIERFVLMSSTGAIGPIKSKNPLDETTECKPGNVYERSKLEAEEILLNFPEIDYTIVRSPRIYGANDPQNTFSFFVKLAKVGIVPVIEHFPISMVYVKNLVQGLMLAATKNNARKETYIISDEKTYDSKEIGEVVLHSFGRKKNFYIRIPLIALKSISVLTGSYRFGLNNVRYSIKKARRELGYKPKYKLDRAVAESFPLVRNPNTE